MRKIFFYLAICFIFAGCFTFGQAVDEESRIVKVKASQRDGYLFDYKISTCAGATVWFYSNDTFYIGQLVNFTPGVGISPKER